MPFAVEEVLKPEVENLDTASSIEKKELATATQLPTKETNTPLEIAQHQEEGLEYSQQEVKALVHKLDWIIIHLIVIRYIFFFADKTTLSYAAIFGLKEDLKLHGTEYSWLSAVFYCVFFFFHLSTTFFWSRFLLAGFLDLISSCGGMNFLSLALLVLSGVLPSSI